MTIIINFVKIDDEKCVFLVTGVRAVFLVLVTIFSFLLFKKAKPLASDELNLEQDLHSFGPCSGGSANEFNTAAYQDSLNRALNYAEAGWRFSIFLATFSGIHLLVPSCIILYSLCTN